MRLTSTTSAAVADGRVHRRDGRCACGTRARRGAQPASVRRPAARRSKPDGADAGASRRRLTALRAEGGRDLPGEQRARPRLAPGLRRALRRRDGRDQGAPQRRGDHRRSHRRRVRRRNETAGARRRSHARDPRHRHPGPVAPRRDAGGARLRPGGRLEPHRRAGSRASKRRARPKRPCGTRM